MDYQRLIDAIPIGKENAIHQIDLGKRLGVNPATAKQMVRKARQAGLQILSGIDGYWFAADEYEKRDFVKSMHKQAVSRLRSASPINNTLSQIEGQISIAESLAGLLDNNRIVGGGNNG